MGEQRDAYVQKLKAKLDEWNADIDKLQAKAGQATADAKEKYSHQIDELKAKQMEAQAKMKELGKAGDEAWQDVKAGADLAWKALGEAVQSAKSRFNKPN